jgi:serine/threonine protein kinase
MAPELFSNDQILYGSEVDVWSLGLVLYELLTKNAYFEGFLL